MARRAVFPWPDSRRDAEGHSRDLCPASDGAYTARCELKPDSIENTTSDKPRIQLTDELRLHSPKCCTQQSVTIPPEAGAKLAQDLHYGSPEWAATYYTLRNTIEGMNGIAKDGAYAALGEATRRRIRGVAPQSVFVALLFLGINVRAIQTFCDQAAPDEEGVRRRHRKRRRATRPLSHWAYPVDARSGAPPP